MYRTCCCCQETVPPGEPCLCAFQLCPGHCHDEIEALLGAQFDAWRDAGLSWPQIKEKALQLPLHQRWIALDMLGSLIPGPVPEPGSGKE